METNRIIKTIRRNPLTCFAGIVTAVIIGSNLGNIQKSSELDRSLADKALAIKASELSRTMDRQLAKQRLQNGCVIALQSSDKTKYFNGLRDGLKVDLPTGSIVCSHIGGVSIVKDGTLTQTIAGDASAVGEAVKNVHSGSVLMGDK